MGEKMKSYHKAVNSWFLATLIIIGFGFASGQYFLIHAADGIVCNDYYVNHKSIEPFYGQYKLDPNVVIHVREVVLAGGERTAPLQEKVLLLLHGEPTPGNVAFDLDYANCSMMRYLAREGWDTFAMDYEGYGSSTRPPLMDTPSAFPQAKAPIHSDVTVNNVERVVDFISNLRGVKKVHILGWSLGASREAPIYTIHSQDRVVKLVLFAPAYMNLGIAEERRKWAD
jgi:pimeloyl-ACP methyl ester carboxylesterase